MLLMDIWVHPYTDSGASGGEFLGNWGVGESKWCHGVMVEATNSFRRHPVSKSYAYKVF